MPRYSGPALAAGAISKAIGDVFEGLLSGQRGGLAAEQKIGEMGATQQEQMLKASAFPVEAALAQAQARLAKAQGARLGAETERIYRMTPEEIGQMRAETGRAGAQTDLLGVQARNQELENRLQENAITHWNQIRAQAQAQNRALTSQDILAFTRQHPVLLRGAQNIPASALLDVSEMEAYLKLLTAQQTGAYKGPEFMLKAREQAFKEAGSIVEQIYGKESGKPEAADAQAWLATAFNNRLLAESLGPAAEKQIASPGQAPKDIVNYVFKQLKEQHPDEEHTTLRSWAYEIISLLGMGAVSWQAAFEGLRKMNEPAKPGAPPVNVPPTGAESPGRSGEAPEEPTYRYSPSTGKFTR